MTSTGNEQVTVGDNAEEGRYEIRVDGELAGATYYELEGKTVSFTHTEVPGRFKGRGLGSQLARKALDDVRHRGLRVLPRCAFIRSFIAGHREYLDLVREADRHRFSL